MESHQSVSQGIHHLGLTVPSVRETADFCVRVLGFAEVGAREDYPAIFVSDGKIVLTLWQAQCEHPSPFDRKNVVGLHHCALLLNEGQTLDEVYQRLESEEGVTIEFAPEEMGAGPTRHFMFTIPGGLRMEIVSPGG